MGISRTCQGRAKDAKAVADRIHEEHSIVVTEQEVLDAQAWLQEERKLTEPPPATEKKDENTTPVTPPSTPPTNLPTIGEHQAGGVGGGVAGAVAATSAPSTSRIVAESPSGTELSEEQIISSLAHLWTVEADWLPILYGVSRRPENSPILREYV